LIGSTRLRFALASIENDAVWVMENVTGARPWMPDAITLNGGMFGLGVDRPRLFESNVLILIPDRVKVADPVGVYGKAHDGRRLFDRADGTTQYAASSLEQASAAMGIDWMTWDEIREAIPPAYTEHIGHQLMAHLSAPVELAGHRPPGVFGSRCEADPDGALARVVRAADQINDDQGV
jgi:hypothetical protein